MLRVTFESPDLTALVLRNLDPVSVVALGRVSREIRAAQRSAIHAESLSLLVTVASNAKTLTKGQFRGWFALSSMEADALPREMCTRRAGGLYYLYRAPAFELVVHGGLLRDVCDWETRLHLRGLVREYTRLTRRVPPAFML